MAAERTNVIYSDGYHLHFSSKERQSGTTSDFTISVSVPTPPNGLDFNRIAVVDCAIPKSWYLVETPYNTFQLVENGTTVTVTVTPGNYTMQEWISQIPPLITAASPNHWVYTATRVLSPNTGTIQYTVAGSGGLPVSFVINAPGDLSEQLGFLPGVSSFSGNTLLGVIPYNSTGDLGIRLRSDICEAEGDSTIADILDVGINPSGSIIRFQLQECLAQTKRFHRTGSTAYRFWLVSATTGRPINLHYLNIVCHIKIYRLEDNVVWLTKEITNRLKDIADSNILILEALKRLALPNNEEKKLAAPTGAAGSAAPLPAEPQQLEGYPAVPVSGGSKEILSDDSDDDYIV